MLQELKKILLNNANPNKAKIMPRFFKHCHDDIYLGISTPVLRLIAKDFVDLTLDEILDLKSSNLHEERTLAHAILRLQFQHANEKQQAKLVRFYIKHSKTIRDWDGVDDSAPYIVGVYLLHREKKLLYQLAKKKFIWDRRIAIVTTWWFIRHGQLQDTLQLAEILLADNEDLVQKAVGWMLREVGKQDVILLKKFLQLHATSMARVTLRYAVEKFSLAERKNYLSLGK